MSKYNPKKVENKWQKYWEAKKIYRANDKSKKEKYYQLETFPYPSAAGLHVGHPKGYIAEDIHARYMRMNGKEVLYTMGWDAFGLPTENYAIKVGKSPQDVAKANIKNFKKQVQMFGLSYDWDREINTSSPEYYKWTQWLFIQLYKAGLAYQKLAKVNWCPKDQTVLANEQVVDGKCERCGSQTEQKEMKQWFFKITEYAEQLLSDLGGLDWPEQTIKRQKDWVGKSEGAKLKFNLKVPGQPDKHSVEVFTTRPDTLFGATFIVVSPELAKKWINVGWQADTKIVEYINKSLNKKELDRLAEAGDKTGVDTGIKAINPANNQEIPVWVADYVLGGYGTGAIMAVPAHDERDHEFAKKFNLPIKTVIEPVTGEKIENEEFRRSIVAVVENTKTGKILSLNWGNLGGNLFIGGGVDEGEKREDTAAREIREETGYKNFELISRSEIIHHHYISRSKGVNRNIEAQGFYFKLLNEEKEEVRLEENEIGKFKLEWISKEEALTKVKDELHSYVFQKLVQGKCYPGEGILTGSGKFDGRDSERAKLEITKFVGGERQTQYKLRDWSVSRQRYWGVPIPMIHCMKCGEVPVPDKDLPVKLPILKDYRPKGVPPLASSKKFLSVKCPNCKSIAKRDPETLDTFVDSSWYYLRYVDTKNKKEFASKTKLKDWMPVKLYVIGAEHTVLHLLYSRFITKFLRDQSYLDFDEPFLKLRHLGLILGNDGQKMSKSKGNVVNPDEVVGEYGADAVRLYEMFMGPFEDGQPWDTKGVIGVYRFLNRVLNYVDRYDSKTKINPVSFKLLNKAVKQIGDDIVNFHFNTCVSGLMKLLNELESHQISKKEYEIFLKLLAPLAPHITEELWHTVLRNKKSIHLEKWPEYDSHLLIEEKIKLIIQVNGKVRDTLEVGRGLSEDEVVKIAKESENIKRHLLGDIKKIIYIKDRVLNLVL